jgi:hypothetical protein
MNVDIRNPTIEVLCPYCSAPDSEGKAVVILNKISLNIGVGGVNLRPAYRAPERPAQSLAKRHTCRICDRVFLVAVAIELEIQTRVWKLVEVDGPEDYPRPDPQPVAAVPPGPTEVSAASIRVAVEGDEIVDLTDYGALERVEADDEVDARFAWERERRVVEKMDRASDALHQAQIDELGGKKFEVKRKASDLPIEDLGGLAGSVARARIEAENASGRTGESAPPPDGASEAKKARLLAERAAGDAAYYKGRAEEFQRLLREGSSAPTEPVDAPDEPF